METTWGLITDLSLESHDQIPRIVLQRKAVVSSHVLA
jgi:hypothetical protein